MIYSKQNTIIYSFDVAGVFSWQAIRNLSFLPGVWFTMLVRYQSFLRPLEKANKTH